MSCLPHGRTEVGRVARASALRGAWRRLGVAGGFASLVLAIVLLLTSFSGWIIVVVAGMSTGLLALDRRLGALPAAMLVMLALPVGRGSEVGLAEIGGYPVRPHDAVALVAAALALPTAVRAMGRPMRLVAPAALPLTVFVTIGAGALVIGVLGGNELRDIVRDARWWAFYAVGLMAILVGTPGSAVIRALTWGMTLYALIVLIGLLMPNFDGGMKVGAYLYDERMRLHYGQAIFLLPAGAFAAVQTSRRPIPWLGVLGLLAAATSVTLTRALMTAFAAVVALAAVWAAVQLIRAKQRRLGSSRGLLRLAARATVPTGLMLVVGLLGGVTAYNVGTQIWAPREGSSPTSDRPVVNASDRLTGREGTDFEAQAGGRLASYSRALGQVAGAPLVGNGLGELTYVDWVRGEYAGHTRNAQPGVDNAYLTVGIKAGVIGIAAIAGMLLWPLRRCAAKPGDPRWAWFVPGWLGILGLTLIESFAVSGYAPLTLSLLIALPFLPARWRA